MVSCSVTVLFFIQGNKNNNALTRQFEKFLASYITPISGSYTDDKFENYEKALDLENYSTE